MAVAFRCKNCGRLEEAEHAGERAVPRGCRVCGKGVHFEIDEAGNPLSIDDPDNWEILAELPASRLEPILRKHQISPKDIVAHVPPPEAEPGRTPQHLERGAQDSLGSEDQAG